MNQRNNNSPIRLEPPDNPVDGDCFLDIESMIVYEWQSVSWVPIRAPDDLIPQILSSIGQMMDDIIGSPVRGSSDISYYNDLSPDSLTRHIGIHDPPVQVYSGARINFHPLSQLFSIDTGTTEVFEEENIQLTEDIFGTKVTKVMVSNGDLSEEFYVRRYVRTTDNGSKFWEVHTSSWTPERDLIQWRVSWGKVGTKSPKVSNWKITGLKSFQEAINKKEFREGYERSDEKSEHYLSVLGKKEKVISNTLHPLFLLD